MANFLAKERSKSLAFFSQGTVPNHNDPYMISH